MKDTPLGGSEGIVAQARTSRSRGGMRPDHASGKGTSTGRVCLAEKEGRRD